MHHCLRGRTPLDNGIQTKWYWTKWYGHNGTDKVVAIFGIDCNSSEFNAYLVTKSHKYVINTQRNPKD